VPAPPTTEVDTVDAAGLAQLAQALEQAAGWLRRTTPRGEWNLVAASALDALDRSGALRISELVSREAITQPAMTSVVARLAAAGLVERGPDPTDGRATLVSITDAGRAHLAGRHALRARQVAERVARLADDDRRALLAATAALIHLAEEERP